jgi:hypothetical protein
MEGISIGFVKSFLGFSVVVLIVLISLCGIYNALVFIQLPTIHKLYGDRISALYTKKGIRFLPFLLFNGILLVVTFLAFVFIGLFSRGIVIAIFFFLLVSFGVFIAYSISTYLAIPKKNFVKRYIIEDLYTNIYNDYLQFHKQGRSSKWEGGEEFSQFHEIINTALENKNSAFIIQLLEYWKEFVLQEKVLDSSVGRSISTGFPCLIAQQCKEYNDYSFLDPVLDMFTVRMDYHFANKIGEFTRVLPKYFGFIATSFDSTHWRIVEDHFLVTFNKFLQSPYFSQFEEDMLSLDYYRKDFTDTYYKKLLMGCFWDLYRYSMKVKPIENAVLLWENFIKAVPSFDELFIDNGIGNILVKTLAHKGSLFIALVDIYFQRIHVDIQRLRSNICYQRCCNYYPLVCYIMDISGRYYTRTKRVSYVRTQFIKFFDQYVEHIQNNLHRSTLFCHDTKLDEYASTFFFHEDLKIWRHTLRQKFLAKGKQI